MATPRNIIRFGAVVAAASLVLSAAAPALAVPGIYQVGELVVGDKTVVLGGAETRSDYREELSSHAPNFYDSEYSNEHSYSIWHSDIRLDALYQYRINGVKVDVDEKHSFKAGDGETVTISVEPRDPDRYRIFGQTSWTHTFPTPPKIHIAAFLSEAERVGDRAYINFDEKRPWDVQLSADWYVDNKLIKSGPEMSLMTNVDHMHKPMKVVLTARYQGETWTRTMTGDGPRHLGTTLPGLPRIKGSPTVGETLDVDPGKWTEGSKLSYTWYMDSEPILGATSGKLRIPGDAVGKSIYVRVDGHQSGFTSVSSVSDETPRIKTASTSSEVPTIEGVAKVGAQLRALSGAWSKGTKFSYQWYAGGKPVKGAAASTYSVKPADLGKQLSVKVTGSQLGYSTVSKTSALTAKAAAGTLVSSTPRISGTAKVGNKLTVTAGTWSKGTKFSYQWYAGGKPVKGAAASTYSVKPADLGKPLSVKITGKLTGYNTSAKISRQTPKAALGTLKTSKPNITGSVTNGKRLSTSVGSWTKGTKLSYQWHVNGQKVKGANKSTYVIPKSARGKQIHVSVTGKNYGFKTVTISSTKTAKVK